MSTTKIEIGQDDLDNVTVFAKDTQGLVQVWFESEDGECSHMFNLGKWNELDAAVRQKLAEGGSA